MTASPTLPAGYGLEEFTAAVEHADVSVPSVSGWRVGMHIHHCGRSMIGIGKVLAESTPPAPGRFPSVVGMMILVSGRIPRGRAKTPEVAAPDPSIGTDDLRSLLARSTQELARIPELDRGTWIRHPALGMMSRNQATRFLRIHNRHHLAIIRDILAAA